MDTSSSRAPPTEPMCHDIGGSVTVADLTLKTTDSGIGSIAQRPTRRSDSGRRRLVYSHVVSGTSSADDDDEDEPTSAAESTGVSDVDVALMWHLARSTAIVQVSLLLTYLPHLYFHLSPFGMVNSDLNK